MAPLLLESTQGRKRKAAYLVEGMKKGRRAVVGREGRKKIGREGEEGRGEREKM